MNKWSVLDAEHEDLVTEYNPTGKVFDPHSGQLEFMEDNAQFLACTCGRRLGKSTGIANEFIPCALHTKKLATALIAEGKRREYWSVGPTYNDAEKPFRVFYNKCKRLGIEFDKPGTYYSPGTSSPMVVSLWDGAFIYQAKSAQEPDRLVGEALSGVHMEEAAKQKEVVWTQMIMPSLKDFNGWAKFTTTPEGKNWYYDLHQKALRPTNLNWNAHRIPSWRNPHVFQEPTVDAHVKELIHLMDDNPGYTSFEIISEKGLIIDPGVAQLANDLSIPEFQQEIAAEFTDFVGKVFKGFDEETHVRNLTFEPDWETIAAVDYGFRNPNVWLLIQIGPWGEINILDELYQADLTADEFAREVLRRNLCPDTLTDFYPDPASPGDTRILETVFRRAGKRARARPHTGGEIDNRLNLIRLALKDRIIDVEMSRENWYSNEPVPDKRRPRMMISYKCPKTIFEFSEYRYPKTKNEETETSTKRYETPMKLLDHTPEAVGRFLAGRYWSAANQFGSGTRITHAQFLRGLGRNGSHPGGYDDTPAGIANTKTPVRRGTWKGR